MRLGVLAFAAGVGCVSALVAMPVVAVTYYTATPVGAPGSSVGRAINSRGQITGEFSSGGPLHAFLYSGGPTIDLGTLAGPGGASIGYGINDSGQVTGYSEIPAGISRGFLYAGGSMTGVGPADDVVSITYGINNSGQITGQSYVGSSAPRAVLYSGGTQTQLGSLGGIYGRGYAINNNGQVTGYSYTPGGNGEPHAFLYSGGADDRPGDAGRHG